MTDLKELRRVAEAATPGEWLEDINKYKTDTGSIVIDSQVYIEGSYPLDVFEETNAKHIATFNPQTAIALLDRLEALERVREAAKGFKCYANEYCMGVNLVKLEEALAAYDALEGGE